MINQILFDDTNVGPYRPPSSTLIHRRGEQDAIVGVVVADYETIEKNL
jgi:hypothetical protein